MRPRRYGPYNTIYSRFIRRSHRDVFNGIVAEARRCGMTAAWATASPSFRMDARFASIVRERRCGTGHGGPTRRVSCKCTYRCPRHSCSVFAIRSCRSISCPRCTPEKSGIFATLVDHFTGRRNGELRVVGRFDRRWGRCRYHEPVTPTCRTATRTSV